LLLKIACLLTFWLALGWWLDQVMPKDYGVTQVMLAERLLVPAERLLVPAERLPSPAQRLTKDYGVTQHPLFLFDKKYWASNRVDIRAARNDVSALVLADDGAPAGADHSETARLQGLVEEVAADTKQQSADSGVSVVLQGLRKEYGSSGSDEHVVAVECMDLTMYEGQILCLLGHNGAGKTTTIDMLTGMVAPTSGKAWINGLEIGSNMADIRQLIGVCPQHDILWPDLTVQEHLEIFAAFYFLVGDAKDAAVNKMIRDVGLTEKRGVRSKNLSGGQRRKLSLCAALIGDSKVVFLDEPTSGMDPYSRRSTWNMLQNSREGRVIILTTHFMDEADLLGDRIAIMAEGRLMCCGSSLFLKNHFGAGYHLTVSRKIGELAQTALIEAAIKKHVPDAEQLGSVGNELTLQLPKEDAAVFPPMLDELDQRQAELNIDTFGMSQVTLEEVFIKVAEGHLGTELKVGGANGHDLQTAAEKGDGLGASFLKPIGEGLESESEAQVLACSCLRASGVLPMPVA